MANRPFIVDAYGLQNPLQSVFPAPIIARRAPTTADTGYQIGTIWVEPKDSSGTAVNAAWLLTSIINNSANWLSIQAGGGSGAGVFTSLTVTPGPIDLTGAFTLIAGTNAASIAADAADHAVTLGSTTGASATTIQGGTSGISATTSATGTITLGTAAMTGTITVGQSTAGQAIAIGNAVNTGAQTISIGSGASGANSTVTILGGNATAGSSALNLATGTGGKTVNLATGAGANTVTIGSTTAGSTVSLATPTGTSVTAANGILISTAGRGVTLPGGLLVLSGAGDPNGAVTAPTGSLFLRSDPAGATSRAYINTNAGTTWTNITCAA